MEDPYERAYLARVRPEPVFGRPGSVAARETMGELMLADEPDEILWRRINLTLGLDHARGVRPAPHPGDDHEARTAPAPPSAPATRPVAGTIARPALGSTTAPARRGVGNAPVASCRAQAHRSTEAGPETAADQAGMGSAERRIAIRRRMFESGIMSAC
ncbi:hypothetical protein SVIOM74S_07987 [Streptomyces violarus]